MNRIISNKTKKWLVYFVVILIYIGLTISKCSDSASDVSGAYWINTETNVRHNSSCRWFGNTFEGYYTGEREGSACGICGG